MSAQNIALSTDFIITQSENCEPFLQVSYLGLVFTFEFDEDTSDEIKDIATKHLSEIMQSCNPMFDALIHTQEQGQSELSKLEDFYFLGEALNFLSLYGFNVPDIEFKAYDDTWEFKFLSSQGNLDFRVEKFDTDEFTYMLRLNCGKWQKFHNLTFENFEKALLELKI